MTTFLDLGVIAPASEVFVAGIVVELTTAMKMAGSRGRERNSTPKDFFFWRCAKNLGMGRDQPFLTAAKEFDLASAKPYHTNKGDLHANYRSTADMIIPIRCFSCGKVCLSPSSLVRRN